MLILGLKGLMKGNDRFARIIFFEMKLEILRRISSNLRKKFIYDECYAGGGLTPSAIEKNLDC